MTHSGTFGRTSSERLDRFLAARPRLVAVAYRLLSQMSDAEDVVQEAWLRWERADVDSVESPDAYLTTIVTRLAIDRLRSAQSTRETYVGPWLPEPIFTESPPSRDPADDAVLADSLSFAFLHLLERLSPVERAVFVLREVFGYPYEEIASMVDRSNDACRQMANRARSRIRDDSRRVATVSPEQEAKTFEGFLTAITNGDVERLMSLLADDVVHLSDGGADHRAARQPVVGPDRVARLLINLAKRLPEDDAVIGLHRINERPGIVITVDDRIRTCLMIDVTDEGTVDRVFTVVNPDKLSRLT